MKRNKLRGWSDAELRFHLKRAGNVATFCDSLDMNKNVLYRVYTPEPADDLYNGRAVMIGGILAKRCSECEVTRSIHEFYGDEQRKDGIRSKCIICSIEEREDNLIEG